MIANSATSNRFLKLRNTLAIVFAALLFWIAAHALVHRAPAEAAGEFAFAQLFIALIDFDYRVLSRAQKILWTPFLIAPGIILLAILVREFVG